jgi:hypothetical protein
MLAAVLLMPRDRAELRSPAAPAEDVAAA